LGGASGKGRSTIGETGEQHITVLYFSNVRQGTMGNEPFQEACLNPKTQSGKRKCRCTKSPLSGVPEYTRIIGAKAVQTGRPRIKILKEELHFIVGKGVKPGWKKMRCRA